jgi:hypothetical protein
MKLAFLELPRDERRLYIEQAAVRGAVRGQVSFFRGTEEAPCR